MWKQTLAVVLLAITPLFGQWLNFPSPGIPRTPDGQPDLFAPAPKTQDGKPDLSGIWRGAGVPYFVSSTLTDHGRLVVDRFRALQTNDKNANRTRCLPHFLSYLIPGALYKIIQAPELVVLLDEAQGLPLPRQIFTDGRPLPVSPNPSWMGYSIGRWDKDTFVVETTGFNDRGAIYGPGGGFPLSETTRITERFERMDFGHMRLQVLFEDPMMFTKPWGFTVAQELVPDTELLEWVCENNDEIMRHMMDPR